MKVNLIISIFRHKPSESGTLNTNLQAGDDYNKKKSILLLFTSLLFTLPDLTLDWDNWPWIGELAKSPHKTAGTTILNLPFNKHNSTEAGRELPVAFQVQVSTANPVHKHTFFPHVKKERPETTNRQARRAGRMKVGVGVGGKGDESPSKQSLVWAKLYCAILIQQQLVASALHTIILSIFYSWAQSLMQLILMEIFSEEKSFESSQTTGSLVKIFNSESHRWSLIHCIWTLEWILDRRMTIHTSSIYGARKWSGLLHDECEQRGNFFTPGCWQRFWFVHLFIPKKCSWCRNPRRLKFGSGTRGGLIPKQTLDISTATTTTLSSSIITDLAATITPSISTGGKTTCS